MFQDSSWSSEVAESACGSSAGGLNSIKESKLVLDASSTASPGAGSTASSVSQAAFLHAQLHVRSCLGSHLQEVDVSLAMLTV